MRIHGTEAGEGIEHTRATLSIDGDVGHHRRSREALPLVGLLLQLGGRLLAFREGPELWFNYLVVNSWANLGLISFLVHKLKDKLNQHTPNFFCVWDEPHNIE
jgi:hypothetical protein